MNQGKFPFRDPFILDLGRVSCPLEKSKTSSLSSLSTCMLFSQGSRLT